MEHDPERGVSLGAYLDRSPGTGVALWCLNTACGRSQKFEMADVVARLDARGLDGRRVGIRDLPRHLTRPCPWCGGTAFEARPDFKPARMGFRREA